MHLDLGRILNLISTLTLIGAAGEARMERKAP
jgi:hypothetical protein